MGQYYFPVILDEGGKIIRTWLHPHNYDNGMKLMESSYINNNFVSAVETLLCNQGMFYKSRVVWAGDYADNELEQAYNLYTLAFEVDHGKMLNTPSKDMSTYRYIVNHSKKLYVDKNSRKGRIHPLPLLTCEGNGLGGGDYEGTQMDLVGSWARDVISIEMSLPDDFVELVCDFRMG